MFRTSNILKFFVVMLFVFASLCQTYEAGAGERGRGPGGGRHDRYYTPHYIPHGRVVRALPRGCFELSIGGVNLFYWEGMYYRRNVNRYVVVPPPVGVVVPVIPQGCQPVVIEGVQYYNVNEATYMPTSSGYQVVPEPKVIVIKDSELKKSAKEAYEAELMEEKAQAAANARAAQGAATTLTEVCFTVNVPNPRGNYTAVTLKRSGAGFIGPQGEYYTEFPSVEQLRAMYAK